jgi:cytochrome c oxidase subunit 2
MTLLASILSSSSALWFVPRGAFWIAAAVPQTIPNAMAPVSTPANEIQSLAWFSISITTVIFVVVASLLTYAIIKYRAKKGEEQIEPPQIYGSTQIELAWTVVPVLIVIVLFLTTTRLIFAIQDAPEPASALDVTVVGHQFWWEFRYPKLGIVTANELHVPLSNTRLMWITVFGCPSLRGKRI